MAQYDVFKNPGIHALTTPYLINVQADLLESLDTCMVIPLRLHDSFAAVKLPTDLVPVFSIEGTTFLLETPQMAAVPRKILKNPVLNLQQEQARITSAIDRLFHGF